MTGEAPRPLREPQSVARLSRTFSQSLSAVDLAEPLVSLDENQPVGAAKQLMDGLGITEEVAGKLVAVGMNAVEVVADVSAQDIVDAAGIDLAAAEGIVNKAKSATVASQ